MRLALELHDKLLRTAIHQNGGTVFKTLGDAFCAAFTSGTSAITAALQCQIALAQEAWPPPVKIRVRMGIHTGAAECRDNQFIGTPLTITERILASARGGQTLVSHATYAITRESLPFEASLQPVFLTGVDAREAYALFELTHPQLPQRDDTGDYRESNALNNLPGYLTSFIGRQPLITEIKAAVNRHRLVTLTGSGGCGKTRLAIKIAAELLHDFPHGVWMVELATVTDPALVTAAIANVLGITDSAGTNLQEAVTTYLKSHHLLLILDNRALQLHGSLGNRAQEALVLNSMGNVLFYQGDYDEASRYYEAAITLNRELGDVASEALNLGNLGNVAVVRGNFAQALFYFEPALQRNRQLNNREGEAENLRSLGIANLGDNRVERSRNLLNQALTLYCQLNAIQQLPDNLEVFVCLCSAEGRYSRSAQLMGKAALLRTRMGMPLPPTDGAWLHPFVSRSRCALGEEEYNRLVAVGSTLTDQQALNLALEE